MERNELIIGTRPLEAGPVALGWWAGLRALLFGSCTALLLCAGTAVAQDRPREDPGNPPPNPGHTDEAWLVLAVPGLPSGSVLGDVWVAPNGDVYVWSKAPGRTAGGATLDEPVEGERTPNPRGDSRPWSSQLLRFDGKKWTVALTAPGETGVALFGTSGSNVFASTNAQSGETKLYRFDGANWAAVEMPGYYLGRLHTMVGAEGDLYFRIDRVVLRHDGTRLQPVFELPGGEAPMRGMVYMGSDGLFVLCSDGHWLLNDGAWSAVPATPFAHVEDSWGVRDANGKLQMFAAGDRGDDSGARVWRFSETDPLTHAGQWETVMAEAGAPGAGCAFHVWGGAGEVYASGVKDGAGRMFRFDGAAWTLLDPPRPLGAIHGVWGTPRGAVWFSAENGTMVRYLPPAAATAAAETNPPLAASERNGALLVRYELPAASRVHIGVYDVAGRMRGTVEDGVRASGVHEASWNGAVLVPGVYFVKLRTDGAVTTKRVVVLR